jgi:hypothetical protein
VWRLCCEPKPVCCGGSAAVVVVAHCSACVTGRPTRQELSRLQVDKPLGCKRQATEPCTAAACVDAYLCVHCPDCRLTPTQMASTSMSSLQPCLMHKSWLRQRWQSW